MQKIISLVVRLLVPVIVLALAGCSNSKMEMAAKVGAAMKENLPQEFKQLRFEEKPDWRKAAPTLVFEGKHAALLAIIKKPALIGLIDPDVAMEGLGRTLKGRYFFFEYTSKLYDQERQMQLRFGEEPCLKAACRTFSGHTLSDEEAKRAFFYSDQFTPERFKEIFGEDAPPKQITA